MANDRIGTFTLWGAANSLYTGKTRSYLIKKGIPYRELYPAHPDFRARIVPVVKRSVVPVLETPEGEIIQDTSDIFDYVEARFPEHPLNPATPVQRTVALLIDAFGTEYLLPTAMHYRWSFRTEQDQFLCAEFGRNVYAGPDRAAQRAAGAKAMSYFSGFLPGLGVSAETIPQIESAYEELLNVLDVHFQVHPYVLGGCPSAADFGLMAPLYAHLARDPVPASLMKNRAPNVYRWTERMNLAAPSDGEFADRADAYFANEEFPATLEALVKLIFAQWSPGLAADAACYNAWIASQPPMPAGHLVSEDAKRRVHPTVGPVEYRWRGITMRRSSAPHALWLFSKAAALARGQSGDARRRIDELLARTGGTDAMAIRLARPMMRRDYALVVA